MLDLLPMMAPALVALLDQLVRRLGERPTSPPTRSRPISPRPPPKSRSCAVVVVLLDTNVWVSALLNPHGPPARLKDAWLAGQPEPGAGRERASPHRLWWGCALLHLARRQRLAPHHGGRGPWIRRLYLSGVGAGRRRRRLYRAQKRPPSRRRPRRERARAAPRRPGSRRI